MKKMLVLMVIAMIAAASPAAAAKKNVKNAKSGLYERKTYVDKSFAAITAENNVTYLHSFVLRHNANCMDTVRVFRVNGYEVEIGGNFSSAHHNNSFGWRCDANMLKGRDVKIAPVSIPTPLELQQAYNSFDGNKSLHKTYQLDKVYELNDQSVIFTFDVECSLEFSGKTTNYEFKTACKVNIQTGEMEQVSPDATDGLKYQLHGGRSLDVSHRFAELHTAHNANGDPVSVVMWR